jgi:hypothetical protein
MVEGQRLKREIQPKTLNVFHPDGGGVRGYGLVTGGVAAGGVVKPLVDGAIDQDLLYLTRGLSCFLPCCAAVVP